MDHKFSVLKWLYCTNIQATEIIFQNLKMLIYKSRYAAENEKGSDDSFSI